MIQLIADIDLRVSTIQLLDGPRSAQTGRELTITAETDWTTTASDAEARHRIDAYKMLASVIRVE